MFGKQKKQKLNEEQMAELVEYIESKACFLWQLALMKFLLIFERLNLEIMKVASSDINDWPLLEKIDQLGNRQLSPQVVLL